MKSHEITRELMTLCRSAAHHRMAFPPTERKKHTKEILATETHPTWA